MKKVFLNIMLSSLCLASCSLFEKKERLLYKCQKSSGEEIGIYYVMLGATTNDVIQIRRSGVKTSDGIIKSFDKYNFLNSSKLLNDSVLEVVLSDTGYHQVSKMDTLLINIK